MFPISFNMMHSPEEPIENGSSGERFERAVSISAILFLLLHLMASFIPSGWTWGFHHWLFLPLPSRFLLIVGLLLCIPKFNRSVIGFTGRFIERIASGRSRLKRYHLMVALAVVFFLIFYILRSRTHFLGDGYMLLRTLESGNIFMPAKPLDTFLHYLVFVLLHGSLGLSAESVYALVSCLSGALFIGVLVVFAGSIEKDLSRKIVLFVSVLFMGSIQLFFGYVESYSLLILALLLYLYFSLSCLRAKGNILPPSLMMSVLICIHISAIILLPTLLYLFFATVQKSREWERIIRQGMRMAVGLAIPVFLLMVLMGMAGISLGMLRDELTRESHMLPLLGRSAGLDSFQYGMLSFTHLVHMLNEIILIAPTAVLMIFPLMLFGRWKTKDNRRQSVFLLLMSGMCFLYLLIIKPDLGASRDWDLFAISGLPWTLLAISFFITCPMDTERLRRIGLVLMVTGALHTIPWILVNADESRSMERFKMLVEKESTWDQMAKGTAYDELRDYYYTRGMNDEYALYAEKAAASGSTPRHSLNLGVALIEKGNYTEALIELEKIDDGSVHAPLAHFNRGNALLQLNRYEEAIEEYRKSLLRQTQNVDAYCNLGMAYFRSDRVDEAISSFQHALRIDPEHANAHFNLGMIYARQNRFQEAISEVRKTILSEPNHLMAHFNLADLYLKQGKLQEALSEYKRVIEIAPDHVEAHLQLGTLYFKQGRHQEAISELKRILEIQPEHADAHFKLGNVYLKDKKTREAVSEYTKAIEIEPNHFEAHSNLGIAYFQLGREEEAVSEFHTAVRINPNHPDGHFNLGNVYIKRRTFDDAITEYRKVLQIDPHHVDARCNLGIAYLQQDRREEAIAEFQNVLEIDPRHETAQQMLARARKHR